MVNFTPRLLKREKKQHSTDHNTLETIHAKNLLSYQMPCFFVTMSMDQAVKEFIKHNGTGGPVIDSKKNVIGYLSQKDCLIHAKETRYNRSEIGTVGQYMSKLVHNVHPETPLRELVDLFAENWYHNYPVVDHGKLIGIIDRHEVLEAFDKTRATTWF